MPTVRINSLERFERTSTLLYATRLPVDGVAPRERTPDPTMPVSPTDSLRDALYPDDLPQEERIIVHSKFSEGFWVAEDDDDAQDLPDDANYGHWMPVVGSGPDDEPRWMSAPEAVRAWIVKKNIEPGDHLRVRTIEKGEMDHDPYEVDLELVENGSE